RHGRSRRRVPDLLLADPADDRRAARYPAGLPPFSLAAGLRRGVRNRRGAVQHAQLTPQPAASRALVLLSGIGAWAGAVFFQRSHPSRATPRGPLVPGERLAS